jgi:uncharacterized repeat protein (TIGR01451 family)
MLMSKPTQWRRSIRAVVVVLLAALLPLTAEAATNQGTGDVAGDGSALTDSNVFTVLSTGGALTLVKRAFLNDGTALASGATVPTGTLVKFMIYVNNSSSIAINDVSMRDVLAALFAYQGGTIKIDNSVANCAAASCTGPEEAAIYAAADAASALTDAVDADTATYTAGTTTIDAGNQNAANGQLNAAANRVLALLFTVQVQ